MMTDEQKDVLKFIRISVADFYNIAPEDIDADTRQIEIRQPRQICMYLAYTMTPLKHNAIGEHFGKKKDGTARSSYLLIKGFLETDKLLRQEIADIKLLIKLNRQNNDLMKSNELLHSIRDINIEMMNCNENSSCKREELKRCKNKLILQL